MERIGKLLYLSLAFTILTPLGCKEDTSVGRFVIENILNENVKIEGYYRPFDFPNRPMEMGEFILEKGESLLLHESFTGERDQPSAYNALRVFLEIQSVDSIAFIFEDNTHLSYTSSDFSDSKNPMLGPLGKISGWLQEKVGENTYKYTFRITEVIKAAAN